MDPNHSDVTPQSASDQLSVSLRLRQLKSEDQEFRQNITAAQLKDPQLWGKIQEEDRKRRKEVQTMLDSGLLQTAEDFATAALIFQHGETLADYARAFDLSKEAIKRGLAPLYSLFPHSFDRFMLAQQHEAGFFDDEKRQRYGTQYQLDEEEGQDFYVVIPRDGKATEEEERLFGYPRSEDFNRCPYAEYQEARRRSFEASEAYWQSLSSERQQEVIQRLVAVDLPPEAFDRTHEWTKDE